MSCVVVVCAGAGVVGWRGRGHLTLTPGTSVLSVGACVVCCGLGLVFVGASVGVGVGEPLRISVWDLVLEWLLVVLGRPRRVNSHSQSQPAYACTCTDTYTTRFAHGVTHGALRMGKLLVCAACYFGCG